MNDFNRPNYSIWLPWLIPWIYSLDFIHSPYIFVNHLPNATCLGGISLGLRVYANVLDESPSKSGESGESGESGIKYKYEFPKIAKIVKKT